MSCAYNELYLPLAQRVMGDMYDYAVNTLSTELSEFHQMFLHSGIAHQFEIGNPMYVAGQNGCEVAREVLETCTDRRIETEDLMYVDKSCEYWIGWALAYYQWISALSFQSIARCVPILEMVGMYKTLHEADITLYVEIMNEKCLAGARNESMLRRMRSYAGMSQRMLAERSGVPLRQIQLFEQGQRDITKTQGQTLYRLSNALHCNIETLLS